ncbi:MAG TPA: DinB family protein [Methylomirabilota bacterium]
MPLPAPVEALWNDLQSVRTRLLEEVEGLSQAQADWRTSDQDWSVGEIVHHLTLAEIGTGKVTSKVLRDAGATVKPFPADLKAFAPLATPAGGRAEAPRPCGRSAASLLLSWSRR